MVPDSTLRCGEAAGCQTTCQLTSLKRNYLETEMFSFPLLKKKPKELFNANIWGLVSASPAPPPTQFYQKVFIKIFANQIITYISFKVRTEWNTTQMTCRLSGGIYGKTTRGKKNVFLLIRLLVPFVLATVLQYLTYKYINILVNKWLTDLFTRQRYKTRCKWWNQL